MTTPAMPELPEPELGYIETDKSRQPAFSARQMRAAMQAQPAAVSDVQRASFRLVCEMLDSYIECIQAAGDYDRWHYIPQVEVARDDLRAILARRPQAAPMTEFQRGTLVIEHLGPEALAGGQMSVLDAFVLGIDAAEAYHGITAPAKEVE